MQAKVDALLDTIWSIAASTWVSAYTIGYTARSGSARAAEHWRIERKGHLVILADKMTRADAQQLESALQRAIRLDKRHVLYRKYDKDRRDAPIIPSVGRANSATAELPIHSVYMSWCDTEFE